MYIHTYYVRTLLKSVWYRRIRYFKHFRLLYYKGRQFWRISTIDLFRDLHCLLMLVCFSQSLAQRSRIGLVVIQLILECVFFLLILWNFFLQLKVRLGFERMCDFAVDILGDRPVFESPKLFTRLCSSKSFSSVLDIWWGLLVTIVVIASGVRLVELAGLPNDCWSWFSSCPEAM